MFGFSTPKIRKGMPNVHLTKAEFEARFRARYKDPVFRPLEAELSKIIDAAWDAYDGGRKAPLTRKAGAGFADPSYNLSTDWLAARESIQEAQRRYEDKTATPRILLINGSSRSDQTCPGEMSKTWRMVELAKEIFTEDGNEVDVLDLSRLTSEMGKQIHPCKACVSTAMPLCHWPCSCYPNYSLQQTDDWMNDIYPLWVAAQGIMIITPVHWYQTPTVLNAMIGRLVCADGGNPDPTSTHGKRPEEAKKLELAGWDYPKHLAGRLFSIIVHGDSAGVETLRRSLVDWLNDMGLMSAGDKAELDRYICYYGSYATSHDDYDKEKEFQDEVHNAATALCAAVTLKRAGQYESPEAGLEDPRKK